MTLYKMAEVIEERAALTSEINRLWNELTPEQEDAMNTIIQMMTKDDSPVVSMSLDELVLAELEWADHVMNVENRDDCISGALSDEKPETISEVLPLLQELAKVLPAALKGWKDTKLKAHRSKKNGRPYSTETLYKHFQDSFGVAEHILARIENKIGYDSQKAVHETGYAGQTNLEVLIDQTYGAIEAEASFGHLHVGNWSGFIAEINEYIAK